jgi:hypothetical protein
MRERIVCPNCSSESYAFSQEVYGPCPFCSFEFHWIRPERRGLERVKEFSIFPLEIRGQDMEATLIDTSKTGAGIAINNSLLLDDNDQIRCDFDKVGEMMDVKVIWSREIEDTWRAGLLFT